MRPGPGRANDSHASDPTSSRRKVLALGVSLGKRCGEVHCQWFYSMRHSRGRARGSGLPVGPGGLGFRAQWRVRGRSGRAKTRDSPAHRHGLLTALASET